MPTKKINVQKLYETYKTQVKILRLTHLIYIGLLITTLSIIGVLKAENIKLSQTEPEIEVITLQLIPENIDIKQIELEELELPPLPKISTSL